MNLPLRMGGGTAMQPVTKTYYSAGGLVAMREITSGGNALYFLHSDHLGSASLTTNSTGGEVVRQSYFPYGSIRAVSGVMPTKIAFTGQYTDETGLMFFQARYLSPMLGRFISADTIVPEAGNPQAWNRYVYVYNDPLSYIDPSGHMAEKQYEDAQDILDELSTYGITVNEDWGYMHDQACGCGLWQTGSWELWELQTLRRGVLDMSNALGGREAFRAISRGNPISIYRFRVDAEDGANHINGVIRLYNYTFSRTRLDTKVAIVHELAHLWDYQSNDLLWNRMFNLSGPIVGGFVDYVKGETGTTDWGRDGGPVEDWAESVAAFVYPAYVDELRNDKREQDVVGGPGLRPLHLRYVQVQIGKLPGGVDYIRPGGS